MAQIDLWNVGVSFEDGGIALEGIDLKIGRGEFVFFIGRSGAGKSTLLHVINGRIPPVTGEVWVDGTEPYMLSGKRRQRFRRKFGLIEPSVGLLTDRNVYENVAFVMRAVGMSGRRIRREIPGLLSEVGLGGYEARSAAALSGGENAKALLARALSLQPDILLADEPTANLDPDSSWDMMCLLEEINRKHGTTVLVATHDRDSVTVMKKRVVTMAAGKIVADEKKAVYNSKASDIFEERRILNERAERKLL